MVAAHAQAGVVALYPLTVLQAVQFPALVVQVEHYGLHILQSPSPPSTNFPGLQVQVAGGTPIKPALHSQVFVPVRKEFGSPQFVHWSLLLYAHFVQLVLQGSHLFVTAFLYVPSGQVH